VLGSGCLRIGASLCEACAETTAVPKVAAESVGQPLVRVSNSQAVLRIVRPGSTASESTAVETAEAVMVEEVAVLENRVVELIRSPAPTGPP
jgi:hypothetical protein